MFKIEGHERYRAHIGKTLGSFERELKNCGGKVPKVTDKKVYRFDRTSGEQFLNL